MMEFDLHHPPKGTIRDWLDHHAARAPEQVSHVFCNEDTPLTWQEIRDHSKQIALNLTALGIPKGQSVALMLPNNRNGLLGLFGVLYGGFRATMINLIAGADAMGYALQHSEAKYVLLDTPQQELFQAALASKWFSDKPQSSINTLFIDDHASWAKELPTDHLALHPCTATDDALLMYTSGTTGTPKGVVHSHASLLAGGWTTAVAHQLNKHDRALCVLPIYHINGLCVTIIAPLVSGGSVAVAEKFSASRFWKQCATFSITWFSVVPTIISHLLHSKEQPDSTTQKRIRFGRSASSALSPDVHENFEDQFGISIVETMGLTETAAQILSNPLPPNVRKIGSPGIAFGNRIKIVSLEGNDLGVDQEGEIWVSGPNVMQHYLNNTEATQSTLTPDGWLRTGDLAKIDADGYVFVMGRLKELIIKGGENIAPREIDDALYAHDDVVEAAAFSCPCKSYGERIEAAVMLKEHSMITAEQLIVLCQQKLGTFKSPDKVHILDSLPKGPSGKIQRRLLSYLADQ